MHKVDQTKFFDKELGTRGNCQQAATASILGLELDEVPNFMDSKSFWGAFYEFLLSKGYLAIEVGPDFAPDCYYLVYGPSSRGVSHCVVYRNGELAHDPHPSREGVQKVIEVTLIVPIEISHQNA